MKDRTLTRNSLTSTIGWLALIVGGAMSLSLVWVFRVPIYQSPDEPAHLDYALCLYHNGGLFHGSYGEPPPDRNSDENIFTHDYRHPYTNYLMERTFAGTIAFNSDAKVSPDYGSAAFFERLDRERPSNPSISQPPHLFRLYPFGYYAVVACWIALLRSIHDSLVFIFFGARILSVVFLGGTLLLVYGSCRLLDQTRRFSLCLTAGIGFFPLTTFISSYIQPDNLGLLLATACFYFSLLARKRPNRLSVWLSLGFVLAVLLITKIHFFAAVFIPIVCLTLGELWHVDLGRRMKVAAATAVMFPSIMTGSLFAWTMSGTQFYHPSPLSGGILAHIGLWTRRAFRDYYIGLTHQSFWGTFGWLDTPLVFFNDSITRVIRILLVVLAITLLVLTLVRFTQVARNVTAVIRAGRLALAWRLAFSNPILNSYFLFTIMMFYLYVRMSNGFGAQGRNWLPFLLPFFLTGLLYVPKVIRTLAIRRRFAATLMAALLSYDLFGSAFALAAIQRRYYAPNHGETFVEQPLAEVQAVEGNRVVSLDEPQFVYGLRLRYTLTNPQMDRALLRVTWQKSPGSNGAALFHIIPGTDLRTLTVSVNETISSVRIEPESLPCHFDLQEVILLKKPNHVLLAVESNDTVHP